MLRTLRFAVDKPKDMATTQRNRPTRILPSNRRKIYAVCFVVTAAWYSILYILGSLSDTNCAVVDCEPWITVLAWAMIITLLASPIACGWLLSPVGAPKRRVKWIGSFCTAGAAVVAMILIILIELMSATPGGSVEANLRWIIAMLMFVGLPLCLGAGYLLVGFGGWIRRKRVSC